MKLSRSQSSSHMTAPGKRIRNAPWQWRKQPSGPLPLELAAPHTHSSSTLPPLGTSLVRQPGFAVQSTSGTRQLTSLLW